MRSRKSSALLVFCLVFSMVGAQPAAWARTSIHDAAESQQYGRKFGGMIGRGLINVFSCFVDVIVHTVDETKRGPAVVGTFTGLGRGLGCGLLRFGSGAVDVVTFWVPGFNGIPVSPSYNRCGLQDGPRYAEPVYSAPPAQPQPTRRAEVPAMQPQISEPAQSAPATQPATDRRWSK